MEDELNSVDAEQPAVVEPQEDVTETGVKDSQPAEAKPIQTPEDNAKYADVRRKTEAETRDRLIDEMYGESHGIKTYAQYQKALAEQKEAEENAKFKEDNGIDPKAIEPLFEKWKQNDPDFKELSSIRQEKNIAIALSDLNSELKDNGIDVQLKDLSDEEVNKIPNIDKVTEYVTKGHSLADAFWLANKKDIISKSTQAAQQDTIKKIVANGASSPGSLGAGGETVTHYTMEQINSMSQADINKNYDVVMASIKTLRGK